MSDHEESFNTGYSTPVPELDDHRHQSSSIQKPRSRRGTVETMHSTSGRSPQNPDLSLVNRGLLQVTARDFEEAVIDEEAGGVSPLHGQDGARDRSRRGTVTTLDPRSVSPPNSVKAFADARRREREPSTCEPHTSKAHAEALLNAEHALHRTQSTSGASCRSHRSLRSRRYTNDNDAQSFVESIKSEAEEDVCFPLHTTGDKGSLQIDFEGLEEFIAEEENREKTPPKGQPQARIFHDLRTPKAGGNLTMVMANGDMVEIPSNDSSSMDEKQMENSSLEESINKQHALDVNRFEFFSSQQESTIHAAEFGDLVLPGVSGG
jgi:magnesium transporter